MRTRIPLIQHAHGRLIGARESAIPLRLQVEEALANGADVVFDFAGVEVTQSFIDALIGVLILKRGPDVLDQMVFKSCSDDARAIIEFVATDRATSISKPARTNSASDCHQPSVFARIISNRLILGTPSAAQIWGILILPLRSLSLVTTVM